MSGGKVDWYNRTMSNPDPQRVNLNQLRPGPIRNESLPPELLNLIRSIYEVVEPYLNTTLEQFEMGFMRDKHPEDEVAIWCNITTAWIDYHEEFLDEELLPDEEEKKLIAALIVISTGVQDVKEFGVPIEVGRRLLACYGEHSEN